RRPAGVVGAGRPLSGRLPGRHRLRSPARRRRALHGGLRLAGGAPEPGAPGAAGLERELRHRHGGRGRAQHRAARPMTATPRNLLLGFVASLLVALLFQLVRLPELLAAARPAWPPLMLAYWALREPRISTLFPAF